MFAMAGGAARLREGTFAGFRALVFAAVRFFTSARNRLRHNPGHGIPGELATQSVNRSGGISQGRLSKAAIRAYLDGITTELSTTCGLLPPATVC
jgi:hypothetical protein